MNGKMSMQVEREVPLMMQRKAVASVSALRASVYAPFGATPRQVAETGRSMKYTGKPMMKSAQRAYESAAIADLSMME